MIDFRYFFRKMTRKKASGCNGDWNRTNKLNQYIILFRSTTYEAINNEFQTIDFILYLLNNSYPST